MHATIHARQACSRRPCPDLIVRVSVPSLVVSFPPPIDVADCPLAAAQCVRMSALQRRQRQAARTGFWSRANWRKKQK